jgi:hypothetical protein
MEIGDVPSVPVPPLFSPTFEFFVVEDGQLMKQTGKIVRTERQPIKE